ncbi:hypothetical protein N3K66_000018 [Trichothecium roseum]|uniref:Uncharacterized protein n=1 Tax=Trichothecium roseum TaxID=47278 RepID=A0ACC0VAS4_9HYPO|nr:hypothetical protein N3K66_000018 [Trichothecium roseum]
MLYEICVGVIGVLALLYGVDFIIAHADDPREPPRLSSAVPLVGHLLGVLRHGPAYYTQTSKQTKAEIYTITILHQKIYVSNSSRLTPLIQRARTLSFRPFLQKAAKVIADGSDETFDLLGGDLLERFGAGMRDALAPGPGLDVQNLRMGERSLVDVAELAGAGEVRLMEWCRRTVVQATSCGIFGVDHPFVDPDVEAAFWTWESYKTAHITGTDLLGTGYAARDKVFAAFREYFENGENGSDGPSSEASFVIRERQRILREGGVRFDDRVKQDASFCTAAFPSTVPTLFWTVYDLFSRPEILAQVREELLEHAVVKGASGSGKLDVAALKTRCPLLLSVYQETQRTKHIHANVRLVTEDTVLDGRWLLRKGAYLQMPGQPIHESEAVWGPAATEYDPYRFYQPQTTAARGEGEEETGKAGSRQKVTVKPNTFLAWGAAPHLCPARQFASTEVMILVALLALSVDLAPAGGAGWDRRPELSTAEMTTLIGPAKDVRLEVRPREAAAGGWALEMGESRTRVSLASG